MIFGRDSEAAVAEEAAKRQHIKASSSCKSKKL
jgi:hypothetical protein